MVTDAFLNCVMHFICIFHTFATATHVNYQAFVSLFMRHCQNISSSNNKNPLLRSRIHLMFPLVYSCFQKFIFGVGGRPPPFVNSFIHRKKQIRLFFSVSPPQTYTLTQTCIHTALKLNEVLFALWAAACC